MTTTQRSDTGNAVDWTCQLQSLSRYAADGVIALGCLVILGWIFDIEFLKSFFSKSTTMKVNTAFCFILSGLSLRLWHQTLKRQWRTAKQLSQVLALSCSLLMIVIAALTLIQDGFSIDLEIDQVLLPQPEPIGSLVHPGRMAPNTAIAFVLVGASLLVQHSFSKQNRTNRSAPVLASQGLALVAGALGFIGLLGHLYGSVYFYAGQSYVRMATHTGVAFMVLSSGIICANPHRGLVVLLTGNGAGSLVMRRLLPVAIVVPIFVGGISQVGYHLNLYSAEVEAALSSTINIFLLAVLIAWNAQKLNTLDLRRAKTALDLQASQARFAGIVEFASDAIISVDANQRILLFNQGAETIFGYSVDQVLGHRLDLLLPDQFVTERFQHGREFGETENHQRRVGERREIYGCRKDGTAFPAEASISKLELNGEILFTVLLQDITERKRNEDVLSRLATIVESSDDAIISKSLDGTILSWNAAAEHMFGYTPEEVVGHPFFILIPPEYKNEELQILERIRQGDRIDSYESVRVRKDNQYINVSVITSSIKDSAGHVIAVSDLKRDITQQKQAEASLQESEARFQAFMDNSPAAAWITDVNGTLLYVNQTYLRTFQFLNTQLIGKSVCDLYPADFAQQCLNHIQTVVKTRQVLQLSEVVPRSDGTFGDFLVYKFLIPSITGQYLLGGIALDMTERKTLERELQHSKAKLNNVLNNVIACIISYRIYRSDPVTWNENRNVEQGWDYDYCSTGCERVFGYTADEFTACKTLWYEHIHPDDWETVILPRYQRLFTQTTTTDEYRFRHKDSNWRWISETSSSCWDAVTQSWIVTVVCTDISDRKQVESILRHSEATKQAIISAIPDLLIQMKMDGSYINFISNNEFNIVNPEHIRQNTNVRDLLPKELAQKRLSYTQKAIKTGKLQTYEHQIVVQGRLCHEEVRIVPLEQDEVLVMVRDITARKQAEEQLRKNEAMLREAQRIAQIGSWEFDFSTYTATWSKEILQMISLNAANLELSYSQFFNYVHPEDRAQFQQHLNRAINSCKPFETDLRVLRPNGTIGYLEVRGKPLCNEQNQLTKLFGTALDVTERKQIELELQQAKDVAEAASQAKSIFLANMSHELRTPLNVILGFTQVMKRDVFLAPDYQETIQIIHRSGEHLLNLINDILDLSKIEAGRTTLDDSSFDLFALLKSLKDMLSQRSASKDLEFYVEISPNVPQYLSADVGKLRQILINLLSNAIKFTEQGKVTLRVLLDEHKTDPTNNVWLYFEVEDTGIGILAHEINTIFDAFAQSLSGKMTPGGTGLGLTISRRFVKLMGGDISVQSVVDQGSTFVVHIPVRIAQATDVFASEPQHSITGLMPGQPAYRVLVVDDQTENRLLLVRLMTQLGMEVQEAKTGRDAVLVWQQWKPHLIWMDILMPEMDGYSATQAIRSAVNGESTVIIALTAHASEGDRGLAISAGCNDFVTKPFDENVLYEKMAEHLGVQFLYVENASSSSQSSLVRDMATPLTAESLAIMPNSWIVALHRAAQLCDEELIQELIQQIPETAIALANPLSRLARNYQFEHIKQLTEAYFKNERSQEST